MGFRNVPCQVGSCRFDMVCAQVEDGGEGLRVCRLGETTRSDPPAWGLGKGLTNYQPKKLDMLQNINWNDRAEVNP